MKPKILNLLIAVLSFMILTINLDWGLPTQERLELLFGEKSIPNDKLADIVSVKNRIKTLKEVVDIPEVELTKNEIINQMMRSFLLVGYAGDEHYVLSSIKKLNPSKLEFDPMHYIYGGSFIYSGAISLKMASMVGYLNLVPDENYYLNNPHEIGKLYFVLRVMVVLFAVAGIYVMFHIVRTYYGNKIALISWLFILSLPVTHQTTHTSEPHIFVLPMFLLAFYFALQTITCNKIFMRKNYILYAVFSGLSVGTQATSIYIGFPIIVSLIINLKNGKLNSKGAQLYFILYAIISFVSCLFVNPFVLLNFENFKHNLSFGMGNVLMSGVHHNLPSEISWLFVFLFPISIIFHIIKCTKDSFLIMSLSCVLPGIGIFLVTGMGFPYVYSMAPFLIVLTILMLKYLYGRLTSKKKQLGFIVIGIILLLISPVPRSIYSLNNYSTESHDRAGRWINENVKTGSTIAMLLSHHDTIIFQYDNYQIVALDKLSKYRYKIPSKDETLPEYVLAIGDEDLLPEYLKNIYEIRRIFEPKSILGFRYHLIGELHGLIGKTITLYRQKAPHV